MTGARQYARWSADTRAGTGTERQQTLVLQAVETGSLQPTKNVTTATLMVVMDVALCAWWSADTIALKSDAGRPFVKQSVTEI